MIYVQDITKFSNFQLKFHDDEVKRMCEKLVMLMSKYMKEVITSKRDNIHIRFTIK